VTLNGISLQELSQGSTVGTSSVRRAAQLRRIRPDLEIVPFRGNVQARLEKLSQGVADGTFLAEAGLRRLGRDDVQRQALDPSVMLPALGQGVLCVQARTDDDDALALCSTITCAKTAFASAVERAFLARLDGSCRTPMAGLARADGTTLHFQAEILSLDGQHKEACDQRFEALDVTAAAERGGGFADAILSAASLDLRQDLRGA